MQTLKGLKLAIVYDDDNAGSIGNMVLLRGLLGKLHNVVEVRRLDLTWEQHLLSHDMVLVDEKVWNNNSHSREAAARCQVVIVYSADISEETAAAALRSGAKGVICTTGPQKLVIEEINRIHRYPGIPTKNVRILIVDNTKALNPLDTTLSQQGFVVKTASDFENALASIESFQPHVVVTNKHLGSNNHTDREGQDLHDEIKNKYGDIIKVIVLLPESLEVLETLEQPTLALIRPEAEDTLAELDRKITKQIEEFRLNFSLKVEFDSSLSWQKLAEMIQKSESPSRQVIEWGLQDLIGKLFYDNSKLRALHVLDSEGDTGALLINPVEKEHSRESFLVRFGCHESIKRQANHYRFNVENRLQGHIVKSSREAKTIRWQGLRFSFSKRLSDTTRDFATLYEKATPEDLTSTLTAFFATSCKHWYMHKERQSPPNLLMRRYQEPFLNPSYMSTLRAQVDKLVDSGEMRGLAFRREGSGFVAEIDGISTFVLTDPLTFVEQLSHQNTYVSPEWCITNASLSSRNILVDESGSLCLTDFHNTRLGPMLLDFSYLEAIIKFELIKHRDFGDLYKFEKALLKPKTLDHQIPPAFKVEPDEFRKARCVIAEIRKLARKEYGEKTISELYFCLLLRALRMLVWKGVTDEETQNGIYDTRQRYAFLSAAMIATRLHPKFQWWDKGVTEFGV
jgi:DNA-binding NarL/FixJ family response regulator